MEQDTAGNDTFVEVSSVFEFGRPRTASTVNRTTTMLWWFADGTTERSLDLVTGPDSPEIRMPSSSANGLRFSNATNTTQLMSMDAQNNICTFASNNDPIQIRKKTTDYIFIDKQGT